MQPAPTFVRRYETPREIWTHLLVYPGHTLPTALAPIFVGAGLALHDGVFRLGPVIAAFLSSWFVHVGGVFADNYALLTAHGRIREHPELNDAVANGSLKLRTLRLATLAWFAAAFVPGAYLFWVTGPLSLLLGAIGIAASAGYATGKLSTSNLGISDPVFVAMFGAVAVAGTFWVQSPAVPAAAFYVGLPMGFILTNVMLIDDIRDVEFDREKGWKTITVRFGIRASRIEHALFTACAYGGCIGLSLLRGPWLMLPWLSLPFALIIERKVWTAKAREELIPWTPRSAFLSMGFGLLLGVGLGL